MRCRKIRPRAVAAVLALAVAAGAGVFPNFVSAAAAAELLPHRALYTLKLGRQRAGSAVAAAEGALAVEVSETCDAWLGTQRLRLTIFRNQGGDAESDNSFTSWESKDGLRYRFRVRNRLNGKIQDDYSGSAELKGPGEGGVARFLPPVDKEFELPRGTMFPTAHLAALIDAAAKGARTFFRTVFDGATTDGPHQINAIISEQNPVRSVALLGEAGNRPSWNMRWAFFVLSSDSAEPDYELEARVYDNGVVEEVTLDYGDFTVVGTLQKFEELERPDC